MVHKKIARRIRRIARKIIRRKPTVTRTIISPTRAGVRVTDFTSGESVTTRTVTSPTGKITTTKTVRGRGGRSVSPQRRQELIKATPAPTIQKQKQVIQKQVLQKQIQKRIKRKVILQAKRAPPKISIRKRFPTTLEIRKEKGFFVLEAPIPPKKGQEIEFLIQGLEKSRLKLRTKIERGQKLTLKEQSQLAGSVILKRLAETSLAIKRLKKVPEKSVEGVTKIIRDKRNIKQISRETLNILKRTGKGIKRGAEDFGRTLRVSPTEAVALIGTEVILLQGSGKLLSVVGKVPKAAAKTIKPIIKKEGKPVKFIGVQEQVGDKIITKVIFSSSKKRGGVAIAISEVKGRRVATVTFGKVGKFKFKKVKGKKRLIGFKQKGVFAGREVSIIRRARLKIVGRTKIGTIVRNVGGLTQVGLGQVAIAKGTALLKTGRKFGVARPIVKKVKGLKIEKFISISAIFTKKDLSLIVGRTLRKKKDIRSFIGLIKGQSSIENVKSFSIQKQRLFNQALSDVAATISASTTKGRKVIPKLSPKSRKVIINRISKTRGVPLAVVKGKLKQVTRKQAKLKAPTKLTIKEKSRLSQLEKQVQKEQTKLRSIVKQRVIPRERQKLRQRQILRSRVKQKAKLKAKVPLVGRPVVPRVPVKVGKKKIPIPLKKRKKFGVRVLGEEQPAYNVFGRPLKRFKGQKQPKLIKLNKKPLSKVQAERLGSTLADTTISRTFKIKAIKGKPKKPTLKTQSFKKRKFRSFRIKKGKRIGLKNTFIEKRKFLIDTRGEKRGLTLRRGLAKLRRESRVKPIKKKVVKKVSTSNQRKIMLNNLKKARAIRMRNLKRR